MNRPCLSCGELIPTGSYCAAHTPQYARKKNTTARGYGFAWQLKAAHYLKTHTQCVWCGAAKDLTVDHIVPKAAGGGDEETNLQTLCRTCNSRKGGR